MLRQGGFPGAVSADDDHVLSLGDLQAYALQGRYSVRLFGIVDVVQVLYPDHVRASRWGANTKRGLSGAPGEAVCPKGPMVCRLFGSSAVSVLKIQATASIGCQRAGLRAGYPVTGNCILTHLLARVKRRSRLVRNRLTGIEGMGKL